MSPCLCSIAPRSAPLLQGHTPPVFAEAMKPGREVCIAAAVASDRLFRTCHSASAPNPMAPHPLIRGLADPAFELPVHLSENPPHVVGLIGCSGHPKLLDLDSEAA